MFLHANAKLGLAARFASGIVGPHTWTALRALPEAAAESAARRATARVVLLWHAV